MSGEAMRVQSVSVRFGRRAALDAVSLSVTEGSVFAVLGRNGAGKSTLVRCMTGQLRADRGKVEMFGEDVWSGRDQLMKQVGVVAEDSDAPGSMRIRELARFSSRLYPSWSREKFSARLDRFGLDPAARFDRLSKGQKKQVSLALALAIEPKLLILDDPTLGLDVVARKSLFEEVIAEMADRGVTVVITTHDLSSIEGLADRVAILRAGQLVLDEDVETLKSRFRRIRFAGGAEHLHAARLVATNVREWGSGTEAVVSNFESPLAEALEGEESFAGEISTLSLEEIFIAVAGEEVGGSR